ncbi:hypothetical protein PTKIN_Ptkin19aG0012500 [Pterospermum kingtungense]
MNPNRVLTVGIHHMLCHITVDVLHQVFLPYGQVEKIHTYQRSSSFQALIQYQELQNAISAINWLQGRNIYDGCCQLDIQFSVLKELFVPYNNDQSRDYMKTIEETMDQEPKPETEVVTEIEAKLQLEELAEESDNQIEADMEEEIDFETTKTFGTQLVEDFNYYTTYDNLGLSKGHFKQIETWASTRFANFICSSK